MTPKELLTAARALIAEPEHWTQELTARGKDGKGRSFMAEDATCWCAIGAIYRAGGTMLGSTSAIITLEDSIGTSVTDFNDSHSHAEVLAAFDKAIESAQ